MRVGGLWVAIEIVCGIYKLQTIFERWQKIKQMRQNRGRESKNCFECLCCATGRRLNQLMIVVWLFYVGFHISLLTPYPHSMLQAYIHTCMCVCVCADKIFCIITLFNYLQHKISHTLRMLFLLPHSLTHSLARLLALVDDDDGNE